MSLSGISVESAIQFILGQFSKPPHVSSELATYNNELHFSIRKTGYPSSAFYAHIDDFNEIINHAARYIMKYSQPYLLAVYLKNASTYKIADTYLEQLKNDIGTGTYFLDFRILAQDSFSTKEHFLAAVRDAFRDKYHDININMLLAHALHQPSIEIIQHILLNAKSNIQLARAYNLWGVIMHEKGYFIEACEMFENSCEENPFFAIAYYNWHFSLLKLGDEGAATEKYQMAIEIDKSLIERSANARNFFADICSLGTRFSLAVFKDSNLRSDSSREAKIIASEEDSLAASEGSPNIPKTLVFSDSSGQKKALISPKAA